MTKNEGSKVVDSSSDDRTANNTLRHSYRELSANEKELMVDIKDAGQKLLDLIGCVGKGRETSLAVTKTEEAVMWAVKGLTK